VATEGDENIRKRTDDVIFIPIRWNVCSRCSPFLPLQLLAYHIAVLRGCDVDKPRNLAKSVTVE